MISVKWMRRRYVLQHKPEIDGLRAIAVAAVVVYHAVPQVLPGGFVGVDVFFVISGYLITLLLADEWADKGRLDFGAFYARRIRRLVPALVALVLMVMLVLVVLLGRHPELLRSTGDSAMWALLFVANFHFEAATGGYFDDVAGRLPLLHLWSLAVEEQFYLVYPALMALLFHRVPGGVIRRLVLLSVASFLLAEYWVHIDPERAFYQMPARFWELAAGGVVALSMAPARARGRDRLWLPTGFALVLTSVVWTPALPAFPASGALPAVLGASLVLLGIHRGAVQGMAAACLRSAPMVGLGLVSYSLYLWHWPLLVIDGQVHFEPSSDAWRLAICVVALVLAILSWRFIEQPFRRGRLPAKRVLVAGVLVSMGSILAALGLARMDRIPVEAAAMAKSALHDQPQGFTRCHADFNSRPDVLPSCWSRPDQAPTVALWGDSHAESWRPWVWRIAEASGRSAAAWTMNSCPPVLPTQVAEIGSPAPENCAHWNAMVLDAIAAGQVELLVLGVRWPSSAASRGPAAALVRARIDGIEAVIASVPRTIRIVIPGPLPTMRRPAPECIARGWELRCSRPRHEYDQAVALPWRELEALARRHPNVMLVDPAGFFCDGTTCGVTRDGYGLYWDTNHITATASRNFAEAYLADPTRYTRHPAPSVPGSAQP